MRYANYQADLDKTYESEVLGEVIFATAARLTRRKDRRRKWLRLKELETQTLNRIVAYLRSSAQSATPSPIYKIQGMAMGGALGVVPWRAAMSMVEHGTQPFLEVFERLLQNSDENSRGLFAYVVAHEKAIAEFARREQAGQTDISLEPIDALMAGT
jgi:hypothetical protein